MIEKTKEGTKRLFFGLEVAAPWPKKLPHGRLLNESCRHLTLAFLGDIPFSKLADNLPFFPQLPLRIGPVGLFNECLLLPERDPHVVAWHVQWLETIKPLEQSLLLLREWLTSLDYSVDNRPFLPHVTLARSPFNRREWTNQFAKLPLCVTNLHLYESKGQLVYEPIWSYQNLQAPFREIEHTADMAFEIIGEDLIQIYRHAMVALSFHCQPLLDHDDEAIDPQGIDQVISALNKAISLTDEKQGCPFKAVSFHGDLVTRNDQLLQWEMIVDV